MEGTRTHQIRAYTPIGTRHISYPLFFLWQCVRPLSLGLLDRAVTDLDGRGVGHEGAAHLRAFGRYRDDRRLVLFEWIFLATQSTSSRCTPDLEQQQSAHSRAHAAADRLRHLEALLAFVEPAEG